MIKRIILTGLSLAVFICTTAFLIIPHGFYGDRRYSGQEVFQTVESYEQFADEFRERVLEDDLKVNTFNVIGLESPFVVTFEVQVPYGYEMPYGETESELLYKGTFIFFFAIWGMVFLFLIPYIIWEDYREVESREKASM